MQVSKKFSFTKSVLAIALAWAPTLAQSPPQPARPGPSDRPSDRPSGRPARLPAYPDRAPADPAVLARGKALYGVYCNFCHGSDARGGEGGPNLLRSEMVLNDKHGELIAPVVQNGRPDQGMPAINLTAVQVSDVAAFLHAFKVGGYDISRMKPPTILVGDAKAGEAYFRSTCGACHSATGDLQGFGARFPDPKVLQNTFLMPGAGGRGGRGGRSSVQVPPTTVTITPQSGPKVEGRLLRIDDFFVTLAEADGAERTFRRDGDVPAVEIHDPMQPHKDLLPKYSDKDIHDLTAYLVTLK